MRRTIAIRTAVTLAVTLVALAALAGPAVAKGPASLTISGPGLDPPVEFARTEQSMPAPRLISLTGLWTGGLRQLLVEPLELGPALELRWLNIGPTHLSVEERTIVQHVYLDSSEGPLIHTPEQASLASWPDEVVGWFAAPAGLEQALVESGVPVGNFTADSDSRRSAWAGLRTPFGITAVSLALVVAAGLVHFGRGRATTPRAGSPIA